MVSSIYQQKNGLGKPLLRVKKWWRIGDSNPWPFGCQPEVYILNIPAISNISQKLCHFPGIIPGMLAVYWLKWHYFDG